MIDARDAALQAACPTLAVPKFGALPDMAPGQRVLMASNGLFLQVKTSWLDCICRIGGVDAALPYGEVKPRMRCAFGKVPNKLLQEFSTWAMHSLPDEVAGALVYSSSTGALRLVRFEALTQSPSAVEYRIPDLPRDEVIAVDLHSHGMGAAYFSATDDADDLGIKIAGVFGNLDRSEPTSRFRLVIGTLRINLPGPKALFPDRGSETWNTGLSQNC
jgi:PRTRC genetic system protein A